MREIKFRAWDGKNMIPPGWWGVQSGNGRMFENEANYLPYDGTEIVMQFTGLKDKNGKEIYEGDVIRSTWNHSVFAVEWDAHNGEWVFCSDCNTTDGKYAGTEVIGNVWENPELISKEV